MESHGKKMIAPIIVSAIMIVYYIVYFGFFISLLDGIWKYILGIIPFLLSAVMVKVCIERIGEIREKAKEHGYFIRCIYVLTANPQINVSRVFVRAQSGDMMFRKIKFSADMIKH